MNNFLKPMEINTLRGLSGTNEASCGPTEKKSMHPSRSPIHEKESGQNWKKTKKRRKTLYQKTGFAVVIPSSLSWEKSSAPNTFAVAHNIYQSEQSHVTCLTASRSDCRDCNPSRFSKPFGRLTENSVKEKKPGVPKQLLQFLQATSRQADVKHRVINQVSLVPAP